MSDYSADPAVHLAQLEKEVRELEDRLEVYATNDDGTKTYLGIGDMDGIGCREETIKILDKNCETLRASRNEAVNLFERIRQFVGQDVDGAARVDLADVEIAIDKWCSLARTGYESE